MTAAAGMQTCCRKIAVLPARSAPLQVMTQLLLTGLKFHPSELPGLLCWATAVAAWPGLRGRQKPPALSASCPAMHTLLLLLSVPSPARISCRFLVPIQLPARSCLASRLA